MIIFCGFVGLIVIGVLFCDSISFDGLFCETLMICIEIGLVVWVIGVMIRLLIVVDMVNMMSAF